MNLRAFIAVCLTLTGAVVAVTAQAANPATDAGLVAVQARDLDEFYVRPNADLAGYHKILVDPARVAFRDDFNKNVTDNRGFLRRLYPEEVAQIASDTAASLGDAVAKAFKARGYEIATSPGPGVLRLSPSAVDLFINAPDARPVGEYKSFTVDAGEATLVLEARDAVSGTLLSRVVDHRRADETTRRLTRTTTVQQNFWLDTMFSRWAATCAKALEATPAAKMGYATQR